MSTPAKSFDELRSILGKLDRKIESARSKRLGHDDPVAPTSDRVPEPVAEEPAPERSDAEGRSPFGRAKPLNRASPGGASGSWLG